MDSNITDDYRQRAEAAQKEIDSYKRLINTYSFIRLGVFILFVLLVVLAVKLESHILFIISFIALGVCFAWLVQRQSWFEQQREYFQNLKKVNDNEIGSMESRSNIYDNGAAFADEKHYYSSDLDIFGSGSL